MASYFLSADRHACSLRLLAAAALVLTACAAPTSQPSTNTSEAPPPRSGPKTLTIGVVGTPRAMSVMGSGSGSGGWQSAADVHSTGLVTSDVSSRTHVGRLAEKVPTTDDGSVSLLTDGRMRVVYRLRPGITWQDGAPFTAHDLVFTFTLLSNKGIPNQLDEAIVFMDSAEATDDQTFVLSFKSPYYLGGSLTLRRLWPVPRHILGEPYERYLATGNPDEVTNLRYWTSDYVHLGPFRLTSFDPGEGTTFRAHEGYFLGRPKLDVVRILWFTDDNILFASLLAGSVDMFGDYTLAPDLAHQIKDRWHDNGEGAVHVRSGTTRFLAPQWRMGVQLEPANLSVNVRAALYHAIDRDTLAATNRNQPAWSLLPAEDRLYDATRDGFRQYAYDLDRARAILREAGWTPGPDGVLRNSADGRRFKNVISVTPGAEAWEGPVYADFWRRIGLDVEEFTIPAAQARNLEFRANYPSWEASTGGDGDSVLGRLRGPPASAENRWVGSRDGYDDPRAVALVDRYFNSISTRDQMDAMGTISRFVASELPILITYYTTEHWGVRAGVKALEDEGGVGSFSVYGSYTRNAYQWDML